MTNAKGLMPVNIDWNSLPHVQDEITRWATEQFPHRTDHQAIYKLMVHEIPEMMTHRKERGTEDIGTELADCFILLLDIASLWEVDIADAIRAKMAINYDRTWEADANGIMQHVKPVEPAPGPPPTQYTPACSYCKSTDVKDIRNEADAGGNTHQCQRATCGMRFDDDCPF